jgi:hypothetical protein
MKTYPAAGVDFANALARRDYAAAYAMTSREYQRTTTLDQMRSAFEAMIPADWGPIGAIESGLTMESWPDRQPSDLGWAYIVIGGEVYSEAVIVVVTNEDGAMKIRSVEFGRP